MKKFMVLYLAPISAEEQMMAASSPEEMQKGMEPWMAWFEKYGTAIVDAGTPLGKGQHLSKTDNSTDYSKAPRHTTGYSIVQAEDMEAVKGMLTDHPHYMLPEGSIVVLEMMPMAM